MSDERKLYVAAEKNDEPEIERLLAIGANVNVKDENDLTPLHVATWFNRVDSHFDTIEVLLKNGADVDAQTKDGLTPLHYVTLNGDVKTVKLLLNYNADVNLQNQCKETPLINAVCKGNIDVVKLLLDSGANVIKRGGFAGFLVLRYAILYFEEDIFKLLFKINFEFNCKILKWMLSRCFFDHTFEEECKKSLSLLLKYSWFNSLNMVDSSIIDASRDFWKLFLQHTAKLKSLDLPIHRSIIDFISKQKDSRDYFQECSKELELAKNTKPQHCWITYFNLLFDNKIKLKNYAGNQDLVKDFETNDCSQKFPIYGASIKKKFKKGLEARKRFDESSSVLSHHLCIFNPSHLIIRGILDCLTLKDYKKLLSID